MDDPSSPDEAFQIDNTFIDAAATAPCRCPAEQPGFDSRVAASEPRQNDGDQTGSRRDPCTTSQAEQSRFDSGIAASAPRLNDGYQTGSRRSPGTTSSYSNRSSKRQRSNSSDDHDDHAIGRGDHDVKAEDFSNQYFRQKRVALAATAPATHGTLHGN